MVKINKEDRLSILYSETPLEEYHLNISMSLDELFDNLDNTRMEVMDCFVNDNTLHELFLAKEKLKLWSNDLFSKVDSIIENIKHANDKGR